MESSTPPSPERLMQLAWGFAPPIILHAVTQLRLLDPLVNGPGTAAALAASAGVSVRGATVLLNALVGLQFLFKRDDHYVLTDESATFLISTRPRFHGAYFEHLCGQLVPQWLRLAEVVRCGQPVARTNTDADGGAHFARFVEALFPMGEALANAVADHLDLGVGTAEGSVLDVGAGSGVWGITLARRSSGVRIRAVDFPQVLEVTRTLAHRHGVADRLTTVAGDFLAADLGRDHDLATLGHILHSEGPERIRRLVARVAAALRPGGRIIITEFVPNDERTGPAQPLIFAVNMLVNTQQGGTYTEAELRAWLRDAGFENPHRLPVAGPATVLIAERRSGAAC